MKKGELIYDSSRIRIAQHPNHHRSVSNDFKNNKELSEDDKNKIRQKITELGEIRDEILSEIYYWLKLL